MRTITSILELSENMNVLSTFTLVVIEFVYNVQMKLIENVKKKNCTPSEKEMV